MLALARRTGDVYCAVQPPSTNTSEAPVMNDEAETKEHDRARDLVEPAPPAHRNPAHEVLILHRVVQERQVHLGRERPRADRRR